MNLKNSNVSPYDYLKHSVSTAQQENPHSTYVPSSYTAISPNQRSSFTRN